MTQSKLHVVECNDEYMTEEHIEHENTMCKDVESSHVQPSSRNVEEGLNDSDDEEYQVDDTVANEQEIVYLYLESNMVEQQSIVTYSSNGRNVYYNSSKSYDISSVTEQTYFYPW
ncbi:hypothetical protein D1007_34418 [Hordeum vulgare]|nr:hypothetical protein D1007_34418 [Hordeum vulgare]